MKKFILSIIALSALSLRIEAKILKDSSSIWKEKWIFQGSISLQSGQEYLPFYSGYYYTGRPSPQNIQYSYETVYTLGFDSYNAYKINKKANLGLNIGLDLMNQKQFLALGIGGQYKLLEKSEKGAKIYASADLGKDIFLTENLNSSFNSKYYLRTGFSVRFPSKNGSEFLINLFYKRRVYNEKSVLNPDTEYFDSSSLAAIRNRVGMGLGFQF
jgi:hypothetical protein